MKLPAPVVLILPILLWALGLVSPWPAAAQQPEPRCPSGAARVACLAERGHVEAQFNMAMLAFRRGGDGDLAEAVDWFRRSAEGGFPRAQYMLAMMLWEGWGAAKDPEAAHRWLFLAEGNGVQDGAGIKPRIENALRELRAAEAGGAVREESR